MPSEPIPGKTPMRRPASGRRVAPGGPGRSATVHQWMQRTPLLLGLQQQALDSRRMGEELARALGSELAGAVQPGRFAEGCWTLSASSPAVAAKLKLHVPLLLRRLQKAGWALQRIQVRVVMAQGLGAPGRAEATVQPSTAPLAVRERLRALRGRF